MGCKTEVLLCGIGGNALQSIDLDKSDRPVLSDLKYKQTEFLRELFRALAGHQTKLYGMS